MSVSKRYDAVAIALHWLMAAVILALLVLGFVMTAQKPGSPLQFQLYQIHKSLGALVLCLTLVRLGWRLAHRPPPLPSAMAGWEQQAARLGHATLYGLMLALPLVGWAVVSTSPFNIPTLLFGQIMLPHLPLPKDIHGPAKLAHAIGAWIMIATLIGHVGAALRHHIVLKDDVLSRMLPRMKGHQ
jgi:cytochrome b561